MTNDHPKATEQPNITITAQHGITNAKPNKTKSKNVILRNGFMLNTFMSYPLITMQRETDAKTGASFYKGFFNGLSITIDGTARQEAEIGITTQLKQTLLTILSFARDDQKDPIISFSLNDYMDRVGRGKDSNHPTKDPRKTKEAILAHYSLLKDTLFSWKEKLNGKKLEAELHIIRGKAIEESEEGTIYHIIFDEVFFFDFYQKYYLTYFPRYLLEINTSQNPLAFELLFYLYKQKRTNGDKEYSMLSLKAIFDNCPSIDNLKDIPKNYFKRKTIERIENNLNSFIAGTDKHYCFIDQKGNMINGEDIPNDKDFILSLKLQFWYGSDFPEDKMNNLYASRKKRTKSIESSKLKALEKQINKNTAKGLADMVNWFNTAKPNKPRKQPQ